jgi:hypothetical protein
MTDADILYFITIAAKPTDIVASSQGQMSYAQWLEQVEMPRIRRKCDWPIAVYTNPKTGEISLAHLRLHVLADPAAVPMPSPAPAPVATPPLADARIAIAAA